MVFMDFNLFRNKWAKQKIQTEISHQQGIERQIIKELMIILFIILLFINFPQNYLLLYDKKHSVLLTFKYFIFSPFYSKDILLKI